MAGFEGADHRNGNGHANDPQVTTGHLMRVDEDYAALARLGIRTVRESLGWRLTEADGRREFTRMHVLQSAARRHGLQIVWTLWHYGVPPEVDLFDDRLIERFADFAAACGREFLHLTDEAPVWTPINEISFMAWLATHTRALWPYHGAVPAEGYPLKRRLVRAALAAIERLRAIDPRARFMAVEPLVRVVAPQHAPHLAERAALETSWQWQVADLLAGRLEPELGGRPPALDLMGLTHYHNSQWEAGSEQRLEWYLRDPRRRPLSLLLAEAAERYGRPLVLAETGHVGSGRAAWFDEAAAEVFRARRRGLTVQGFCLYPAVDSTDWDRPDHWHNSGLWDLAPAAATPAPRRVLNFSYARELRGWQRRYESLPNPSPSLPSPSRAAMPSLIVFSHLRWDFVFQRPQHLMTRLAQHYRIHFVEEPIATDGLPYLERYSPLRNLEVLRPHTRSTVPGFNAAQLPELRVLLSWYLAEFCVSDSAIWTYTPMALPLATALRPRALVYDCMDELSAFQNAPSEMLRLEGDLLARADLVFTGGPSLYEAKRHAHPDTHCFPSAADAAHFAPGTVRAAAPQVEQALAALPPGPRLGFYGVIDERFDTALLEAVAAARPDWQLVLLGPVAKIDPAHLPQRPNLHWLGQQPYADLPQWVAGWDVALLPFVDNASTRFISPTKTLEYMAAEKPVVGTAVRDVASLYGDAVRIARTAEEFTAACAAALAEPAGEREARLERMRAHVARHRWDDKANRMRRLLDSALERNRAPAPAPARRSDSVAAQNLAA
jgi:glycosyltransferase involved in cell wall biosynthesis